MDFINAKKINEKSSSINLTKKKKMHNECALWGAIVKQKLTMAHTDKERK